MVGNAASVLSYYRHFRARRPQYSVERIDRQVMKEWMGKRRSRTCHIHAVDVPCVSSRKATWSKHGSYIASTSCGEPHDPHVSRNQLLTTTQNLRALCQPDEIKFLYEPLSYACPILEGKEACGNCLSFVKDRFWWYMCWKLVTHPLE